ncbi:MAG: hypothetical protein QFY14_01010 [Candidatus Phytoplasma pruni]|uniref:Immunodominant protein n=1 Tax=Western X phytoplasma TaxID=37704 RepID=Q9AIX3_9MOLU|nr:immunodominant protein [Western X phytoplasma]AAP31480.1 immunodominant protein [Western X phytoplasma]MDW3617670.1 hypothetical protein [Candidatus Phytoplasma pruni]
MFSQNKNYLSKFLQLTGILSVFILIFFSHNKVFGNGKNIKDHIVEIKNQDQQKDDIKTKAAALLQEISTFETDIKKIFTTANIQELQKIFEDAVFDSLSTEITNKLTTTQNILQADKNILDNMQQLVKEIQDQKPNYLSDASILSKAGEKTLEEVKTAFIKIMGQTQLLKTHMETLETKKTELTDANKLSDTHINNLINKIKGFLNKSQSSKLEDKNTQLTKIETDYQKLKKSETAATTTKSTTKTDDKEKSINTFQIIIIGVFITIMISVIIVWILQQIKKNQSKR